MRSAFNKMGLVAMIFLETTVSAQAHTAGGRWIKLPSEDLKCVISDWQELDSRTVVGNLKIWGKHNKQIAWFDLRLERDPLTKIASQCTSAVAQAQAEKKAVMFNIDTGESEPEGGFFVRAPQAQSPQQ